MFWDCFERQACEIYPRGLHGLDIYSTDDKSLPSKDNDRSKPFLMNLHEQWSSLVSKYSACGLTFQTDKLIAISALARRFATYFEDDYIAGMWRKSLENDLLW